MTSLEQAVRVRELIAQETPAEDDKPAVAGWLQRVCRAAGRDLPAMGVGISLLSKGSDPLPVAASNEMSVLVEELQFVMGEGPCIDAYASRSPILVPDLAATAATTWPGYAPAAHLHGVRAVFAFPLQIGAARLGALDIYREHTGNLTYTALSCALTFAEVAMQGLLDGGTGSSGSDLFDDLQGNRYEVYQAQGMIMAQLDISAEEALMRLRAYAYARELRAIDVAHDVLARRLTLESDA